MDSIFYQWPMPAARSAIISPELRAILHCCGCAFDPRRANSLAALVGACDPYQFARLAERHRVEGLVWDAISAAAITLPAEAQDRLSARSTLIQAQNLRSRVAIAALRQAAKGRGIDLLLVKGLATGVLAYRNPDARTGRDIDVLVSSEQVAATASLLGDLGYVAVLPASDHSRWHQRNKESVWQDANGLIVELHSRLADSPAMIPSIGVQSPRRNVTISGTDIETLSEAELIAYSCVHGGSSLWFRAKWIADLAGLLWAKHGTDPADDSYAGALKLGAGKAAGLAFLLCHDLFRTPIGASLLADLRSSASLATLQRMAMRQLASGEPTARRFGTMRIRASQLLLMPTVGAAAKEAVRQMIEVAQTPRT